MNDERTKWGNMEYDYPNKASKYLSEASEVEDTPREYVDALIDQIADVIRNSSSGVDEQVKSLSIRRTSLGTSVEVTIKRGMFFRNRRQS
jgi:hypothetical protein